MKSAAVILLAGISCFFLFTSAQAQWGTTGPAWQSNDDDFTMSVALADLDNDGDLDLVAGNYKYPYQFNAPPASGNPAYLQWDDIGDYIKAYRHGPGSPPAGFDNAVNLINTRYCIDCIAIADFDHDEDLDIAMGLVVGKGGDGGVKVLKNQYHEDGWSPTNPYTGALDGLFSEEDHMWSSFESFDCHCVRWVDNNCDGHLDLAALEVGGNLRIYENDPNNPNTFPSGLVYPEPFGRGFPIAPDKPLSEPLSDDGLSEPPSSFPLPGTTMEFGDMDGDGDLDVFVNIGDPPRPKVYRNLMVPGFPAIAGFDSSEHWEAVSPGRENQACASFGFFQVGQDTRLALAIGSMTLGNVHNDDAAWRNDIYSLNDAHTALEHNWQSLENYNTDPKTQLVTDIQWARVSGTTAMDLVTSSYAACNSDLTSSSAVWERGQEYYYRDPAPVTHPTEYPDPNDWSSPNTIHDRSTSLALGDIDNLGVVAAYKDFLLGITPSNVTSLLYLTNFPLMRITEVKWRPNPSSQVWTEIPDDKWCVDLINGWISIDREYIADIYDWPLNAIQVRIEYLWSPNYDLAIGNDGKNLVYEYNGPTQTINYTEVQTHPYTNVPTNTTYEPADYGLGPGADPDLNLMANDCLGATDYGWILDERALPIADYLDAHQNIRVLGQNLQWSTEMFQGHYFWDWSDKWFDAVFTDEVERKGFIYDWGDGTPWIMGGFYPTPTLHAMFVRNLVNRYRPNGIVAASPLFNWGNRGVTMFSIANEPNAHWTTGTTLPSSADTAITRIAEMMFRNYQVIKTISINAYSDRTKLAVVSPNWGTYVQGGTGIPYPPVWGFNHDKYNAPPIPYLNALNDVYLILPDQTADPIVTNVLWKYCDYICQQLYNDKEGTSQDPFAPAYVPGYPGLKLGIEHWFWSYYTAGLWDYYGAEASAHDFSPVMQINENSWSEHPFMTFEWTFEADYWNVYDEDVPKADWTASEIAELFSVDVFPDDATKHHRLLKYNLAWEAMDPRYEGLFEVCANLLNDPEATVFSTIFYAMAVCVLRWSRTVAFRMMSSLCIQAT